MPKTLAPAKTPGVAIARVLRGLGLKQGLDFRVRGGYKNGERFGTIVSVMGSSANQTVADNADQIEQMAADAGFHFNVSIHFTPSGMVWVWVANHGQRTRETHFLSPSGRTENTATEAPQPEPKPVIRATLGEPRSAFGTPASTTDQHLSERRSGKAAPFNPYTGFVTQGWGPRVWGRTEAGNHWFHQTSEHGARFNLRHRVDGPQGSGWYMAGPGIASSLFMAATLNEAVPAAGETLDGLQWLTLRMDSAPFYFPKGQRVQGVDSHGVTCMGTVNGVAWGAVTDPSHQNFGRTWVDVDWDEMPHNRGTGRRSRPFTSDLIKH